MRLTGHQVGLLKEYMRDLVEQARQDEDAYRSFGFKPTSYRSHQAISDLLAILDDRIESEGVQVGLPEDFLHQMWTLCDEAQTAVKDLVWLESGGGGQPVSKSETRELTYRALLEYLEEPAREA